MQDWNYIIIVFIVAYSINLLYISVFYHRGLAHRSIILKPFVSKFVVATGPWVIGLDAAAWCVMHRLHHEYADEVNDPHSPHNGGLFSVFKSQLIAYKACVVGLILKRRQETQKIADLNIDVHWLYKKGLWYIPYILHLSIAVLIAYFSSNNLIGVVYFMGLQSHPIQGWLVNALAHSKGYRNFNRSDKSVNNLLLGYFVFGEGYQNNHHEQPDNPNFSAKWWEIDMGYGLCLILKSFGLVSFKQKSL